MLIKKELGINIINSITDPEENYRYLILLVELNEKRAIIASIYGPNVHNPYFFQNLYRDLKSLGDFPLVMGGDFNATFSSDPIDVNIDCMVMIDIPNYRHSKYIGEFCEALNLMDPFRFLYPNKKEFSYKPFGDKRKNRSRIDFFLISYSLLNDKIKCTINPVVLAPCFDHKSINLIFPNENSISRPNRRKKLRIFESTLRDPDLDIVIWYTVFETYLHHFRLDPELIAERNRTLEICGTVRKLLSDAGPSQSYYYNDLSMDIINACERCLTQISSILESLPLELVHNFDIDISADLFISKWNNS